MRRIRSAGTGIRPGGGCCSRGWRPGTVRNHSKFISIDHRFLLVTSANFSWSAEYTNLEFGLLVDNPNLAESVERELHEVEDLIFERVQITSAPGHRATRR
jgi:hypothetical protein